METWSRRMPPAKEFIAYLDLGKLVCQTVPSMAVVQTELRSALLGMHSDKACLGNDRPLLIEAKCIVGILMNGMSRCRDLRFPEKLEAVLKLGNDPKCERLREFAAMITVTYDKPGLAAICDQEEVKRDLQIVPAKYNLLVGIRTAP